MESTVRSSLSALFSLVLLPSLAWSSPVLDDNGAAAKLDFSPGGPIADDQLGNYHVAMECAIDGESVGSMSIVFWPEKAPVTVRNFLRYCAEGFYDGKTFHRIIRGFMVQGGDPQGTGAGNGPHGNIKGEFSDDPKYGHHYGVISMARSGDPDSASCQFFICCAESGNVWNLDGGYASFGKLVHGVSALERLASVKTAGGREGSTPTQKVTIVRATVVEGQPKDTETIEQPAPDLGGEPIKVKVQHVLISFTGRGTQATRTQEEAEKLAADILARANQGDDFTALVREFSDDPSQPDDPHPGTYRMTNKGVVDPKSERAMFELSRKFQAMQKELTDKMQAGEMTQAQVQETLGAERDRLMPEIMELRAFPREQMAKAFGDVAFSLKAGEIGLAAYAEGVSPFGWHIIKRIE